MNGLEDFCRGNNCAIVELLASVLIDELALLLTELWLRETGTNMDDEVEGETACKGRDLKRTEGFFGIATAELLPSGAAALKMIVILI